MENGLLPETQTDIGIVTIHTRTTNAGLFRILDPKKLAAVCDDPDRNVCWNETDGTTIPPLVWEEFQKQRQNNFQLTAGEVYAQMDKSIQPSNWHIRAGAKSRAFLLKEALCQFF